MANYVDEKIRAIEAKVNEINLWTLQQINGGKQIDPSQYMDKRLDLNVLIVEAMSGCDVKEKKDKKKLGAAKKMPTPAQITKCATIVDSLANGVERQAIENFAEDETGIPYDFGQEVVVDLNQKPKELMNLLFDENGSGLATTFINGTQCMVINQIAKAIRKDRLIKGTIIIAGVAIVIAVGVIVAILLYRRHKEKTQSAADLMEGATNRIDDNPVFDDISKSMDENPFFQDTNVPQVKI